MPQHELFVLRHGQTEWNRAGRHQGQLDSPLTEEGRRQALRQGGILQDLIGERRDVSAFVSPLGRAMHTAELALKDIGLEPSVDERLKEVHFGKWQGLTSDQIAERYPDIPKDDPFLWNFLSPGGESFQQMRCRVKSFLDDLNAPSVVICHGITSILLRGLWLGCEPAQMHRLGGGQQGVVFHLADGMEQRFS